MELKRAILWSVCFTIFSILVMIEMQDVTMLVISLLASALYIGTVLVAGEDRENDID